MGYDEGYIFFHIHTPLVLLQGLITEEFVRANVRSVTMYNANFKVNNH